MLIRDRNDLAEALQISFKKLAFLVGAPPFLKYTKFLIPKRSDGFRIIEAPKVDLKIAQKRLYKFLEPYYSPLPCVHGFVSDRSILTGVASHLVRGDRHHGIKKKTRFYFALDIEDFFPSITSQRIYGLLVGKRIRSMEDVAFDIAKLCIGERGLAQGSPVSPLISNMICLNMDRSIMAFAKSHGLFYTRYADDITLSTSNRKMFFEIFGKGPEGIVPTELERAIAQHKGRESFRINEKKIRCLMPEQRQLITGIVVNEKMNVRREYYRTLRSCLHTWNKEGKERAAVKYYKKAVLEGGLLNSFEARIKGKLEYYRNVVSENHERCTPLEKLGSMFNRCCEESRFSIHKPEDSIFNITAYPICEASDNAPEEGVAFYLDGVGIVTARHVFDKFAMDGVPLKVALISIATNEKLELKVPVSSRDVEKRYDCVKIEIDDQLLARSFSAVAPMRLADLSIEPFPVLANDVLTAFDVELVADADQGVRGYGCTEVSVTCMAPSSPNQYGRMAQVQGAEFYKGMSGGPVINRQGDVVGIVKSGVTRGSGSRYARSKLLFLDRLESIPYGIAPKE